MSDQPSTQRGSTGGSRASLGTPRSYRPYSRLTIDTPSALFSRGRGTMSSGGSRPMNRIVDEEEQSGSRISRLFGSDVKPFSWLDGRGSGSRSAPLAPIEVPAAPPRSESKAGRLESKPGRAELKTIPPRPDQNEKMEALRTLISGLAHQVRNPCATVRNNMFLLDHRLKSLAKERPELGSVVAGLRRYQAAAVEGVVRIETTMAVLRRILFGDIETRIPFDLSVLTRQTVEAFHAGQGAEHDIEVSLAPSAPVVGDPRRVREVLEALLTNAAEAMPKGGAIKVGTKVSPKGPQIDVIDSGVGIPTEHHGRLFEPYFTSKPDHAGLGLAVARGIVNAHGGRLDFESAPRMGSRFRVSFPS